MVERCDLMAQKNQNVRTAGQASFLGGANSGLAPQLLGDNGYSWGVNTTLRGGAIGPRPGYLKQTLSFDSETTDTRFSSGGRFQGAGIHENPDGKSVILVMVAGRLFSIEPCRDNKTVEVTPGTTNEDVNHSTADRATFQQAEDWTIVQNNIDAPIIYGNGASRRSTPMKGREVPTGLMMAYGNGRVWVSKGRSYVAGDLVGSSSGSGVERRDAVLRFTENDYLAEGGAFRLPTTGDITGMKFVSNLDTALGDGDLIVFSRKGGYAVSVPTDRTLWKNLDYPAQRSAVPIGAVSGDSIVNVNGDLYYRSPDGLRSLVFARRQFGTPGNTPISEEVDRAFQFDAPHFLDYSSAVLFDNRYLCTCTPQKSSIGVHHKGLVALDFAPVSFMGQTSRPVYDGMWTGVNILKIMTGSFDQEEKCFAIVESASGTIEVWEITKDATTDFDGTNYDRIQWFFETRAYNFASNYERAALDRFEPWLTDIGGQVDITVYSRPDTSANWYLWKTWQESAKDTFCSGENDSNGCQTITPYNLSYRPRRSIGSPSEDCENLDPKKPVSRGYSFQFRVQVTGQAQIPQIRAFCNIETEDRYRACPPETATQTTDNTCPLEDYLTIT